MKVSLLQTNLYWHDPVANRAMLEERIFNLSEPTDLIVLPEMFTTGFTMDAQAVAESMNLTTFRWMKQMAAQTGAVITGSYVVQEKRSDESPTGMPIQDGPYHQRVGGPNANPGRAVSPTGRQFFNRLIWMQPDGQYDIYDKRHLFRMAGEEGIYTAGTQRIIKEWKGWRICPLICYDLRFPVWSRNVQADSTDFDYDLLLYVANWPVARRTAWNTLLQARAIENLSYVVGVNRVGEDGNGHSYAGESAVVDFKGDILFRQADSEIVHQQTLSLDELRTFRTEFPANLDADTFTLR